MSWRRVKEESNLMKRLEALMDKADELKLRINFENNSSIRLMDLETDTEYHFLDLEADVERLYSDTRHVISFPPLLEYKLCREIKDDEV